MRLLALFSCLYLLLLSPVSATKLIKTNSLNLCSESRNLTAKYFSVTYTPANNSLSLSFDLYAAISGHVTAELVLSAYGYEAMKKELDPCQMGIKGLCPMNPGEIPLEQTPIPVPASVAKSIPGKSCRSVVIM